MRIRMLLAIVILSLTVLTAATGCSMIRTQASDQRDAQLADMQRRIEALEQQQASLQKRFDDSTRVAGQALAEYERMQDELASLQGRFDEVQHGSDMSQGQLETIRRQLMVELDKVNGRIAALEGQGPYDPQSAAGNVEETQALNQAMALFNQGNYEAAKAKFSDFLAKFKKSKKRDEAQFHIAECYFKQGNWEQAILEFDGLVTKFPTSTHVPTAYLHMGISFYENGQISDARLFFEKVVSLFPGTPEAKIAAKKLQMMQQ